ncbi:hypothetical protein IGI04_023587 [Brassica rapa subsp. trilocularis]|uniref:F-box domain-containing protein n=1 Tax=Brassica rapa subsp. trilocularis TaxID=1813537 RepID=A0ABQ7M4B8_BRACM|nr:hypothetical protein IGI04_023587 [Brassica rapa subsp. trilocularis]
MKQGDSTVREYNTLFLKSGLLEIHQQETLVRMYRDGLREEIRAELGFHVFSTIDDIMQAALDVEKGDESDESGNRSKEKSRSGECETSGDTDGSTTESDESGNRPKKKARTGEDFLENLDGQADDIPYLYGNLLKMEQFPILSLPTEVQGLVVKRVAHNSFEDLFRLRATCKAMRSLADDEDVYASRNMYVEGLDLMKRAADAGFERASYTYAMTSKLWDDDGDHIRGFSRDYVAKIGLLVRSSAGLWNWDHYYYFHIRRHVFISTVAPTFFSCPCSPLLDGHWALWDIDNRKAEDMCNRHPPVIQTLKRGRYGIRWQIELKGKGKGKGKGNETDVRCFCALPAKKCKSWTDKILVGGSTGVNAGRLHLIVGFSNGSMRNNLSDGKSKL